MTDIWISKLTIIGSDNGLVPGQHQAIIRTNAGILLIESLGTNFNEILISIHFYQRKCTWKCRQRNSVHFVWAPMCYVWVDYCFSFVFLINTISSEMGLCFFNVQLYMIVIYPNRARHWGLSNLARGRCIRSWIFITMRKIWFWKKNNKIYNFSVFLSIWDCHKIKCWKQ